MDNNILEFMILESGSNVDPEIILILDNPELSNLQGADISINFDGIRSNGSLSTEQGNFTFGPLKKESISHLTAGRMPVMLMDTSTNIIKDVELLKISEG